MHEAMIVTHHTVHMCCVHMDINIHEGMPMTACV